MKNKKGASVIILVFSLLALLGLASFALDMGIILNQRYELQKAVESAALITTSEYEPFENGNNFELPAENQITDATTGNASLHYQALLDTNQIVQGLPANPTITMNIPSKAVMIEADTTVTTYFLQIIGINSVTIQAKAAAVNVPSYLSSIFPKPTGSILRGSGAYLDTDIRQPLGSVAANTTTVYNQNANLNNIYGPPDGRTLSLGPGGFITIKLPVSLVDGKGIDFAIHERGHAEGYSVFAGIDADPTNPYADASSPGGGIKWVNVSCTGIPINVNKNGLIGAHRATVSVNGMNYTDYKFYGSGVFDLGTKCVNNGTTIYDGTGSVPGAARISNVKYLKIIDDNTENGFYLQSRLTSTVPAAIPTFLPGEHSMFTPGADIDAVEIYHHSRLIDTNDFINDTDGDGIIDLAENMYGVDPAVADTDGDGINDLTEIWGYNTNGTTTLQSGPSEILFKDYPTWATPPPLMEVNP